MKQILYVEDSATSQLLMRKYLNGICDLTITPSLSMAKSLLEERSFDLLIADFLFPEGDALDLIQSVRQMDVRKEIPVVVISSSMDGALLGRVLKAGANEGLAKPLNTDAFRAVVTRMLTAPYSRSLDNTLTGVVCFQWTSRGTIHQYCPELNLMISGNNKDDVAQSMLSALQDRLVQGAELGYTSHEAVVTHIVHG
jgi:CheY-like chemotaxis protein